MRSFLELFGLHREDLSAPSYFRTALAFAAIFSSCRLCTGLAPSVMCEPTLSRAVECD